MSSVAFLSSVALAKGQAKSERIHFSILGARGTATELAPRRPHFQALNFRRSLIPSALLKLVDLNPLTILLQAWIIIDVNKSRLHLPLLKHLRHVVLSCALTASVLLQLFAPSVLLGQEPQSDVQSAQSSAPSTGPANDSPVNPSTVGATRLLPQVSSTAFRRDDGHGAPGIAVAHFFTSDRTQHFEVAVQELDGVGDSMNVQWVFQALETSVGTRDKIASSEQRFLIPADAKEVLVSGMVTLPRDWPIGRYRANVSVNGSLLRMLDYVVTVEPPPPAAPPTVTSVLMLSDDGRGEPDKQRTQFIPTDRKIHFRANLSSRFTGKARWRFTAVTTAAGNDVPLLDLQGDVSEVDYLVSQMSAPKDWPVGVYRAEVFLNDSPVRSFDFTISNN